MKIASLKTISAKCVRNIFAYALITSTCSPAAMANDRVLVMRFVHAAILKPASSKSPILPGVKVEIFYSTTITDGCKINNLRPFFNGQSNALGYVTVPVSSLRSGSCYMYSVQAPTILKTMHYFTYDPSDLTLTDVECSKKYSTC